MDFSCFVVSVVEMSLNVPSGMWSYLKRVNPQESSAHMQRVNPQESSAHMHTRHNRIQTNQQFDISINSAPN